MVRAALDVLPDLETLTEADVDRHPPRRRMRRGRNGRRRARSSARLIIGTAEGVDVALTISEHRSTHGDATADVTTNTSRPGDFTAAAELGGRSLVVFSVLS